MIFLIGGNGFVGSAFRRALEGQREFQIITRENYAQFQGKSCDILINANGNSSKMLGQREPLKDFDASVRSVRASLQDFRYERYIHLSSCDVYPDCSSPATTAESGLPNPSAQSPYGFHKHLAEQCVQHAARNWLIFRLGGFIGPGLKKNAIFDILQGGPLWLDTESSLQFLSTDECARIVLRLADGTANKEVFNLCGRGVVKLADVVKLAGRPIPVSPNSPLVRYEVNISKVSSLVEVPETEAAVASFVRAKLQEA